MIAREHSDFLFELQDSGVTNMMGAGPYLVKRFGVTKKESHEILSDWMANWTTYYKRRWGHSSYTEWREQQANLREGGKK